MNVTFYLNTDNRVEAILLNTDRKHLTYDFEPIYSGVIAYTSSSTSSEADRYIEIAGKLCVSGQLRKMQVECDVLSTFEGMGLYKNVIKVDRELFEEPTEPNNKERDMDDYNYKQPFDQDSYV